MINAEKSLDRIKHPFISTFLSKMGIERNFLNLIRGNYEKSPTNIIFHCKRLNNFSLKSETRHKISVSLLLFHIVVDVIASARRQEK